jgi:hypothetical protein
MKRFALALLSVSALSVSGCCWPSLWSPCGAGGGGGGCPNGQCAPQMFGTSPTGWQTGGFPGESGAPVAFQPTLHQQAAFPQQFAPTMAVESLPTFR